MGTVLWGAAELLVPSVMTTFIDLLVGVAVSIAIGLGVYALLSHLLKSPEYSSIVTEVMKGIGKR